MKEQQSSASKVILPNKELVGVKKEIDESSKLPEPTGWRILVLPFKQKEKTKGGILLADETVERSQVASTCGLVLKMGPHCYDKERYPEGPWCKSFSDRGKPRRYIPRILIIEEKNYARRRKEHS
jgi:hypothetical protein